MSNAGRHWKAKWTAEGSLSVFTRRQSRTGTTIMTEPTTSSSSSPMVATETSSSYVAMDSSALTSSSPSQRPAAVTTTATTPTSKQRPNLLQRLFVRTSPSTDGKEYDTLEGDTSQQPHQSAKDEHEERHIIHELLHFAKHRDWKKKLLTVFIVLSSAYVLIDLIFFTNVRTIIVECFEFMKYHPWSAVVFFLGFFLLFTLLFVPPAIIMLGAGYTFTNIMNNHFWWGLLASAFVCSVGSTLSAMVAFFRSRYMMRDLILLFSKRYPIVAALDKALQVKGFRIMLLLRLCPIIPFNGLNYIGGVTSISLEDYVKALIGVLPTILLWCFCGASADQITVIATSKGTNAINSDGAQLYMIILISVGLVFCVVAALLIWKYAIEELKKEIYLENASSMWKYNKKSSSDDKSPTSATDYHMASDEPSSPHENPTVELVTAASPQHPNTSMELAEQGREVEMVHHQPYDDDDNASLSSQRHHGGVLTLLGFDANGLDGYYSGRDDGRDEEWFWIWS